MESIKISVLQELFKNKSKYEINSVSGHRGIEADAYYGRQGEYNETFIYYRHPEFPENIFMKETYRTDSYGNGDMLQSVEFVKGKEKTITVFEPI